MNRVDLEKIQIIAVTVVMVCAAVFLLAGTFGVFLWIANNL